MTDTSRSRRSAPTPTVTLKHVAQRAGVAPITVSRALNAPESVSAALRTLIDAAVSDLGYVPNRFAGALATATSRFVPLIVPSLSNSVFIEVIQGVQAVLEPAGYEVLLGNTHYDLSRETDLVRTLLGWSPVGMLVGGLRHAPATVTLLKNFGRPVVEIMEVGKKPIDMNVGLSHEKAGQMMGRHLISRGYRELGFIGGRLELDYRAMGRFQGFDRTLRDAGLTRRPPFTHNQKSGPEIGGDALMRAMADDPDLDAVFFANDDLAVGALLRAQREGIAVPGRIAIAGFNGLEISRLTNPPLTTIVSPRREIGETAARKLLSRIAGEHSEAARVDLGCKLVVREST